MPDVDPGVRWIHAQDQHLCELARSLSFGRLVIGQQADRFVALDGPSKLGFSSLDAYTKERLSLRGRHVADAARLADRLEAHPAIGAAYAGGRLLPSMADLIARKAEVAPDLEGELLDLALSAGVTVHAMRDYVRAEEPGNEPEDERCTVDETVPTEVALLVEATRMADERLSGGDGRDFFEHLVAEGMSTFPELFDGQIMPEVFAEMDDAAARSPDGAARLRELEERAEPDLPDHPPVRFDFPGLERVDPHAGPYELDAAMRRNAMRLASRDLLLGQVAKDFFRHRHWQKLGYATEQQYCRERLGMSRTAVRDRITLATRCERLPLLAEELRTLGGLGYEHAKLIARIATPRTVEAWIDRARRRTYKDLRVELRCLDTSVRMGHLRGPNLWPPTDEDVKGWEDLERHVLSGALVENVLGPSIPRDPEAEIRIADPVGAPEAEIRIDDQPGEPDAEIRIDDQPGEPDAEPEPIQISAKTRALARQVAEKMRSRHPRRRKGELRFRDRTHPVIARMYRAARERWRRLGHEGHFLAVLCVWWWETWLETLRAEISKYGHVHQRDRMRCASPGCSRRVLSLHHILERMLGGDDQLTNLVTLCDVCHLKNVHELRSLRVSGEAPHALMFLFGTHPIFAVHGREKIAAA